MDGPVLVAEALDAGVELEALYVESATFAELDDRPGGIVHRARARGVALHEVRDGALGSVLDLRAPQGVVAVAVRAMADPVALVSAARRSARPLLVLVELADPGNVGTLLRVAEAAGCVGALVSASTADVHNPKSVRASAGSVLRLPVADGLGPAELFDLLDAGGLEAVATSPRDGAPPESALLHSAFALVVGSEAHGLPDELHRRCDRSVTVPLDGAVESLNAAVAGAAVLFDAARQRRAARAARGTGSGAAARVGHDVGSIERGSGGTEAR